MEKRIFQKANYKRAGCFLPFLLQGDEQDVLPNGRYKNRAQRPRCKGKGKQKSTKQKYWTKKMKSTQKSYIYKNRKKTTEKRKNLRFLRTFANNFRNIAF